MLKRNGTLIVPETFWKNVTDLRFIHVEERPSRGTLNQIFTLSRILERALCNLVILDGVCSVHLQQEVSWIIANTGLLEVDGFAPLYVLNRQRSLSDVLVSL